MQLLGDKPLSQHEMNKRYREKHNQVLFAARIDGDLLGKLHIKLAEEGKTKKGFIEEAIKRYLKK